MVVDEVVEVDVVVVSGTVVVDEEVVLEVVVDEVVDEVVEVEEVVDEVVEEAVLEVVVDEVVVEVVVRPGKIDLIRRDTHTAPRPEAASAPVPSSTCRTRSDSA